MGSSAGHESSSQCKTIKAEARINGQAGLAHVIVRIVQPGPAHAVRARVRDAVTTRSSRAVRDHKT